MKKLLLLLSLPLVLFGCSKDRNLDGQTTISDMGLAFQDFFIPLGRFLEDIINSFIKSDLGKFLELTINYPDRAELTGLGIFTLLLMFLIIVGVFNLMGLIFDANDNARKARTNEIYFKELRKDKAEVIITNKEQEKLNELTKPYQKVIKSIVKIVIFPFKLISNLFGLAIYGFYILLFIGLIASILIAIFG